MPPLKINLSVSSVVYKCTLLNYIKETAMGFLKKNNSFNVRINGADRSGIRACDGILTHWDLPVPNMSTLCGY